MPRFFPMTAAQEPNFADHPGRFSLLQKTGLYGLWTSEKYFNPDMLADAFGNVPGELVDTGNRLTKPVANLIGTYVTTWDRILQDKPMDTWLAMNKWVNDGCHSPARCSNSGFCEFYQQNKLIRARYSYEAAG